LEKLK